MSLINSTNRRQGGDVGPNDIFLSSQMLKFWLTSFSCGTIDLRRTDLFLFRNLRKTGPSARLFAYRWVSLR